MSTVHDLPVHPRSVIRNPSFEELRGLIAKMPNARLSEFRNYNVETRVLSRSKASTFVVTDDPTTQSDQILSREEGAKWARLQDEYVRNQDMIVIEGYIGNDPAFRVPARLIIEVRNANIAAMQKALYFDPAPGELKNFQPKLQVIYTPNLPAPGKPNDRLIAVYLDQGITRVFNSDYFGESKKGGLRMWNKMVYERGGLPMHAGAKIVPVGKEERTMLIVGLSGTGKTTTTFTRQNDSMPVQDDFVALMPGGKVYATENGCFAKTYGLDPKFEPAIYRAVTKADAYLENVYQDPHGKVDFFNETYTQNGRAVFRMASVEGAADASRIRKADFLLILNRNDNLIPAVARLSPTQAAAYFMLGETRGTSAGGADEAGKFLRVPGTNPFFPMLHANQGNRLWELLQHSPMQVFLLNTGRVGGGDQHTGSKKVKIPHSSAVVKAIAEGTIRWTTDPDFGYEVATHVPDFPEADLDILQPRLLYEGQERMDEYRELVKKIKADRAAYMQRWAGLRPEIAAAIR
ncbi:MAG: phosphoenolpyruvate carboxykinase [Planctomycetes bacterium]|nr:phosphoenolpyruvate carboxykinase [Planctomycetota bacterium]